MAPSPFRLSVRQPGEHRNLRMGDSIGDEDRPRAWSRSRPRRGCRSSATACLLARCGCAFRRGVRRDAPVDRRWRCARRSSRPTARGSSGRRARRSGSRARSAVPFRTRFGATLPLAVGVEHENLVAACRWRRTARARRCRTRVRSASSGLCQGRESCAAARRSPRRRRRVDGDGRTIDRARPRHRELAGRAASSTCLPDCPTGCTPVFGLSVSATSCAEP